MTLTGPASDPGPGPEAPAETAVAPARACPRCSTPAEPADLFCEECGAELPPPAGPSAGPDPAEPPGRDQEDSGLGGGQDQDQVPAGQCPACLSTAVDDEGYCLDCGLRRTPTQAGDHTEVDLGRLAGVSDRGLAHRENEDAMGLALVPPPAGRPAGGPALVAVVCDGVSTAPGSGPAAAAAAAAATSTLSAWLTAPPPDAANAPDGPDRQDVPDGPDAPDLANRPDVPSALRAAARAGQQAITAPADGGPAPACTFAAAVVSGSWLTAGWLGDSRVYLLGDDGATLRLTADDTVAAEAVRAGLIPAPLAETAPGAHTITRWLGPDAAEALPHIAVLPLTAGGRVVVCSDGLWNYASTAAELAALVAGVPPHAGPLAVARHLTAAALRAGGRDNVTVVVIDIPGSV